MKTRFCFVSNSSSSSFLIALKAGKDKKCKCCGRANWDLAELVWQTNNSNDDNEVNFEGQRAEVIDYYNKLYNDYSDPEYQSIIELIKKHKPETKFLVLAVSYHDKIVREEIEVQNNNKDIDIINIRD